MDFIFGFLSRICAAKIRDKMLFWNDIILNILARGNFIFKKWNELLMVTGANVDFANIVISGKAGKFTFRPEKYRPTPQNVQASRAESSAGPAVTALKAP